MFFRNRWSEESTSFFYNRIENPVQYFSIAVTCLASYDINDDGIEEIIVGRDDGMVDVYGFEDGQESAIKIMSHVCLS